MAVKLINAPAQLAVKLEEAKRHLRIPDSNTALDTVVQAWVAGIITHAEHVMGRAIINQTWRVSFDCFPDVIRLPRAPLVSVNSVKYYDANSVQQTLPPDRYQVDGESEPGRILPAPDTSWPDTADRVNAVAVEYVCGYGADENATPAGVKLYLLAKLVEQFDAASFPEKDTIQATFIDRLLDPYRIWSRR